LFETEFDYDVFERIISETLDKCPMHICSYCLMPNHWHFVMGQLNGPVPVVFGTIRALHRGGKFLTCPGVDAAGADGPHWFAGCGMLVSIGSGRRDRRA